MQKQRNSMILSAVRETAEGLHRAGLMDQNTRDEFDLPQSPPNRHLMPSSKELGDDGEQYTCGLLRSRGYDARLLEVNARTYDLHVQKGQQQFLVSVKVARDKQHVRLGSRRSVLGLEAGNFVFAYLPIPGHSIVNLKDSAHTLLILPAEIAQMDALSIHDPYWLEKEKDPNIFSVMVKGYGSHHRTMWPRWLEYSNAWHLLP
jgi:hypothetical protein